MLRLLSPLVALLFLLALAPAASSERDVDDLEDLLPRAPLPAERARMPAYLAETSQRLARADAPPVPPVRNCAEWEPATGVLIRYPLGLPYALLRALADDVLLHVVVSASYESLARTNLAANGIDLARVQFLVKPNDSIWTRDYGPWFVFAGGGQCTVIDHVYNRPRDNDDLIPVHFADQQALPLARHDMVHTGGNYMTDGSHFSASTDLVYQEAATYNELSPAEVDALMHAYYGVTDYQVVPDIESGGIHHIDTWAKFLDEETVLVKEVWPGHHTHAALEQRATLIGSLTASTGRPYLVRRVYCPDIGGGRPAAYTNSLILNGRIHVPLFGLAAADTQALAAYRAAAPGYDVRGHYHSGWLTDDALHCRVMGVTDRGMLRLAHVPLRGQHVGPVTVGAHIRAHSGAAITRAELVYRHDGGDWQAVPLAPCAPDSFAAVIPTPTADALAEYQLLAADASGRAAGIPRVAPLASCAFWHVRAPTAVADHAPAPPAALAPNRPNPFNPATVFSFALREAAPVELAVLDLRGRRVRVLVDDVCAAGQHELVWDGCDEAGRALPSGVYRLHLRAAGICQTRPVTLVR